MMYQSPYDFRPSYIPSPYFQADCDKREIRRLSNRLNWMMLACIFLMTVLMVVLEAVMQLILRYNSAWSSFNGLNPVLFYLIDGIGYLVGIALPVLIYFAASHIPLEIGLPFHKTGFLKTASCVFFGSAVCMLANIPASMVANLEKHFGFSGELPPMPLNDNPWVLAFYGVGIVIIPPLVEEMLFRGMLLQSLRRYGDGFAIFASALAFGLYHGNFIQMVFAFPCGIVMGLVAVRTNSLLPSILIHFLNNGTAFAVEMITRYRGSAVADQADSVVSAVLIGFGILGAAYLLMREKDFFHTAPSSSPLRLSSKLGAFFLNFGGIATVVYAVVTSIYSLKSF